MSPAVLKNDTSMRIVKAAAELFDQQGYNASSVNDIIDKAGISKPTFYTHFRSKEELCVAYLQNNRKNDMEDFRVLAESMDDPMKRFLSPFDALQERMKSSNYRGCRYFNMLSEVVDNTTSIAHEVRHFNDRFRAHLRDLTLDLKEADSRYANIDPDRIVTLYALLFGGAIMASQEYESIAPVLMARKELRIMVQQG